MSLRGLVLAAATAFALAGGRRGGGGGGGGELCILFASLNVSTFHFGRVDFAAEQVVDLLPLPPSLEQVFGGCAAGADDGQFFLPNDAVAYNNLLEISIAANTTQSKTMAPPVQYAGSVPVFFTMNFDPATGDIRVFFLESTRVAWVAAAIVDPANGSSVAISADFSDAFNNLFMWKKTGVSAYDSKRSRLFFVAKLKPEGSVETLFGVPVGDASVPVEFVEIPGPSDNSSDIDFLGYSAPHDLFVATCFNINVGIASIKIMPADGAGGDAWQTVYEWPLGAEFDEELGNAALTRDGNTLFVALQDPVLLQPTYFSFAVPSGKLLASFTVPRGQQARMLTAEVVAC